MLPLNRGNEMVIQFSTSPHHQQHKISEDLILDGYCSLDSSDFDKRVGESQPKKLFHGYHKNFGHQYSIENKKKMIHREIERQRRQQMATLHASLRSLLPLEFTKGKRSMSDHMNEAVNYIKLLKKNIKELSIKRDELKKLSCCSPEYHDNNDTSGSFAIHKNDGAIGIEIIDGFREESFPLSKLLELLLEEGLEVISCLSSEVNGRLIHSIQCEVSDFNCLDLPALRRKVSNVISLFRNSN